MHMKMQVKGQRLFYICAVLFFSLFGTTQAHAGTGNDLGAHPYYLHALSDLRAARWMIEHRPGNWVQTQDEIEAVRRIDKAIGEIKKASIEDGKNIEDHEPVSEVPDHMGRLHKALDFLRKARQDISHDEDNVFAQGLQSRAYGHIDGAIGAVKRAIHS
jgi:tetratricopeptide (TPR) repeat protein